MTDHNVEMLIDSRGNPQFTFQPPDDPGRFYECFNFNSDPIKWVVLGWEVHGSKDGDCDNECVEAHDTFGEDWKAALAKLYEIINRYGE